MSRDNITLSITTMLCRVLEEDMAMFGPPWWHHHGIKMRVTHAPTVDKPLLVISSGDVADLSVSPSADDGMWILSWKVVHNLRGEYTLGERLVTTEAFRAMFGLQDACDGANQALAARFRATAVLQGAFVRWNDYLNVPAPGMGHDGDPNVSLEITTEMKSAVMSLIELREKV